MYSVPARDERWKERKRGEGKRKRQSASTIPSLAASAPFSVGAMCSGPAKGHKTKVGVGVRSGRRGERERTDEGVELGKGMDACTRPNPQLTSCLGERRGEANGAKGPKTRLAEIRGGEQEENEKQEEKREGTRERAGEDTENEGADGFA